jgi:hypothetical protein
MTRYISTKETAAMLRKDLARAWPGVKFSVRMSTGTASAWLRVTYTDGPTYSELRLFCSNYEGRQFNGMTDGYDDKGTTLIVVAGEDLPDEVRFSCDGINSHREYSPAARLHAQSIIDAAGHSDIRTCTDTGEAIHHGPVPSEVVLPDRVYDYLYSPAGLAERILSSIDLSVGTGATKH